MHFLILYLKIKGIRAAKKNRQDCFFDHRVCGVCVWVGAHFLILLLFSHNNVFKRCGFKKSHFYFGALYQVWLTKEGIAILYDLGQLYLVHCNEFTVAGSGSH